MSCTPVLFTGYQLHHKMSEAILPFIPTSDSGSSSSISSYMERNASTGTTNHYDISSIPPFSYCQILPKFGRPGQTDPVCALISFPSLMFQSSSGQLSGYAYSVYLDSIRARQVIVTPSLTDISIYISAVNNTGNDFFTLLFIFYK